MKTEKRVVFTADARLDIKFLASKSATSTAPGTLSGYAIVWNSLSTDRGGYQVRLLPGSARFMSETLALHHHQYDQVIGNTANGTLRIANDQIGARVEIDLPNTSAGRDVEELVAKKYIRGMSFAMIQIASGRDVIENGQTIFEVTDFLCDEVTVTPIPAFTDTSIQPAEVEGSRMAAQKKYEAEGEFCREQLKLEEYGLRARRL